MANLSRNDIHTIEAFVANPVGFGYVLDFSNVTFSKWFEERWNVNIDKKEYQYDGNSKRKRLISFCQRHDTDLVASVLEELWSKSEKIPNFDADKKTSDDFWNLILKLEIAGIESELPIDTTQGGKNLLKHVSTKEIQANLKINSESILLNSYSILFQIVEFREKIRINNQLGAENPEFRDQLIEFLDNLHGELTELAEIIQRPAGKQVAEVDSWLKRFGAATIPEIKKIMEPENLGKAVAPISIILSCGVVGSLLTGLSPLGFGAGTLAGKLITGEIKPGKASDDIVKNFED